MHSEKPQVGGTQVQARYILINHSIEKVPSHQQRILDSQVHLWKFKYSQIGLVDLGPNLLQVSHLKKTQPPFKL